MPSVASPLSVQCCKDYQNFLHGNSEYAWLGQAHQSTLFDQQYFRYYLYVLWHRLRLAPPTEVYGDPEVHPQHED